MQLAFLDGPGSKTHLPWAWGQLHVRGPIAQARGANLLFSQTDLRQESRL